ncbi:MAG: nitrous oxide reductase accessory protein NosL [Dehalococcoidia bacterium]
MGCTRRDFLRVVLALGLVAAAPGLASCGRKSAGAPKPPPIRYGRSVCAYCGMIINEARYAAGAVLEGGSSRLFDDIGDMFLYFRAHPEERPLALFVHDYATEQWIRAETAYYVVSPQILSPMGHGIAAFAQRPQAEAFAQEKQGRVLDFSQALMLSLSQMRP